MSTNRHLGPSPPAVTTAKLSAPPTRLAPPLPPPKPANTVLRSKPVLAASPVYRPAPSARPTAPPVYSPKSVPAGAQRKTAAAAPPVYRAALGTRPAAPPVYTPNASSTTAQRNVPAASAPPVYRPTASARPPAPPVYSPQTNAERRQPSAAPLQAKALTGIAGQYVVRAPIARAGGYQEISVGRVGVVESVGSVRLHPGTNGQTYLSDLEVSPDHRRHGVAKMLVQAAQHTASAQGHGGIVLEASPSAGSLDPQSLISMYQRMGFRRTGWSSRGKPLLEFGPVTVQRKTLPASAVQRMQGPPLLSDSPELSLVPIFDITGRNMAHIARVYPPAERLVVGTPVVWMSVREKASKNPSVEEELEWAIQHGVPVDLINRVFTELTQTQLEKLNGSMWEGLKKARLMLEHAGGFTKWLRIAKLRVIDIPGFKMLLTDKDAQAAEAKAIEIINKANLPPAFSGKSYDDIVETLVRMGYKKQEGFRDSRNEGQEPYGQDVWTSNDNIVVRIKVGGRSLAGRFPRPPHVVKEITKTAHQYSPGDIICKLTDHNILIPAGTKYSAKDMQAWYEDVAHKKLGPNAWKSPNASGDPDFAALHHLWAEGAHTTIGSVPNLQLAAAIQQNTSLPTNISSLIASYTGDL